VGLVAPLVLLALYCQRRGVEHAFERHRADVTLALGSIAIGAIAIALCPLFAQPESRSHLVATLQPMRSFLFVYYCMFLLMGGLLGQYWLKHVAWRRVLLVCALGCLMYGVERATYPALAQVELPWVETRNPWAEAFLWVRMHTPADAVVALDADYIQADREDAQGFRAIAERSSLADFSKDGGSAAIFPALAEKWMVEHTADTGLSRMSDAERKRRLAPFHVHWLILQQPAATALACPYTNERVKVCQLP
jgi:MFS family permease